VTNGAPCNDGNAGTCGDVCIDGVCTGTPVDLLTDEANCGICGNACIPGGVCFQGNCCAPSCSANSCGQSDGCGGVCQTCPECQMCYGNSICLHDDSQTCNGGTGRCCLGSCIGSCLPTGSNCHPITSICSPSSCQNCCNGFTPGSLGFNFVCT
jgi:hypothetical protein